MTVLGVGVIGFVYWFFFGKKEAATVAANKLTVTVEGGYKPSVIRLEKDKTTTLTFLRKDSNSCLEELVFPDFKIKRYLPMNEQVNVEINPKERGKYEFHCAMNMFKGKIVVG